MYSFTLPRSRASDDFLELTYNLYPAKSFSSLADHCNFTPPGVVDFIRFIGGAIGALTDGDVKALPKFTFPLRSTLSL